MRITHFVACISLLVLISGCVPTGISESKEIQAIDSITPTLPPPQIEPTQVITAVSTASETTLSEWKMVDLRDPEATELIIPGAEGKQLDSNWMPDQLTYTYSWGGLDANLYDYQQIDFQNGIYVKDGVEISNELIKKFLNSIIHLHNSQYLLVSQTHTDDYPEWIIKLSDQKGSQITLISQSNGSQAPWNIVYNGRVYAQYDGSLIEPVTELFPGPVGVPSATFSPGGGAENTITFASNYYPVEISKGYSGLSELADGFSFYANSVDDEILIDLYGNGWMRDESHAIKSEVAKLLDVVLTNESGDILPCELQPDDSADPNILQWEYKCPVSGVTAGLRFKYPINIAYMTRDGVEKTSIGQLSGMWIKENNTEITPLPEELQVILSKNPLYKDLLTDLQPVAANYAAQIKPDSPETGSYEGEVVFLGETQLLGKPLKFTIATPFAITNGNLSYWTLTHQAVYKMLNEITGRTLTKKILNVEPDVELNMWYAEKGTIPNISASLINYYHPSYSLDAKACGSIPEWSFPKQNIPLEAFGFNNRWAFYRPQFVLLNGEPIVSDLDFGPYDPSLTKVKKLLIPARFNTEAYPPFERVWVEANSFFGNAHTLSLWIPRDAGADALAVYQNIAEALPVPFDKTTDTVWNFSGITLALNENDDLDFIPCDGK